MSFNTAIPGPNDLMSNSQGQIQTNFSSSNTTYGIDHYPFTNSSSSRGFHNKVTTPLIVGSAHPATAANPIFYAMQDSANLGVIQYSRGPNNAQPTPLTFLQSPSTPISLTPGATTNVFNFTGLTQAMAMLWSANLDASAGITRVGYFVRWINNGTGTVLQITAVPDASTNLQGVVSGSILQLKNTSGSNTQSQVFWTLQFLRIN